LVRGITEGLAAIDPDVLAFITAAGITDLTQIGAINGLVLDLKAYGLWTKMKAIYPFVGGTANSHKYNLKDPQDTNAAFRLVFNGGWTHSANGAQPNGTNGYADTFYNPNVQNTQFNIHLSNYSRTQNSSINGAQLGAYDGTNEISLFQYFSSVSVKGGSIYIYPSRAVTINNTNTLGLQTVTRTANNNAKLYFNGALLNTNTNTETLNPPNRSIYLGASNWFSGPTQYTPHQHAFDSIGDGLTDTEAANFYTAVQTFQTTLGRQV
jgi:hypothetical protein